MFKGTKPARFNAVVAVEAKIRFHPRIDKEPNCELLMMHVNTPSWMTFGTCPVKPNLLSEKTRKALIAFLESAEEDYGNILFDTGVNVTVAPGTSTELDSGAAESGSPVTGLGDT